MKKYVFVALLVGTASSIFGADVAPQWVDERRNEGRDSYIKLAANHKIVGFCGEITLKRRGAAKLSGKMSRFEMLKQGAKAYADQKHPERLHKGQIFLRAFRVTSSAKESLRDTGLYDVLTGDVDWHFTPISDFVPLSDSGQSYRFDWAGFANEYYAIKAYKKDASGTMVPLNYMVQNVEFSATKGNRVCGRGVPYGALKMNKGGFIRGK